MIWSALAAIASLFLIGIKIYVWYYKKKTRPAMEDDIQAMHNAIAKGDADTLSELFDRVRRPPGARHKIGYDDPTPP